MRSLRQSSLCCPCGRSRLLAHGLCATCYTLHRQDEQYFGGLREAVLRRDGHRCRCCQCPAHGRRTINVHHRAPGVSTLRLMITLCPACHAKVHRTAVARREMTPLLFKLWREQHPHGHVQLRLGFQPPRPVAHPESLVFV